MSGKPARPSPTSASAAPSRGPTSKKPTGSKPETWTVEFARPARNAFDRLDRQVQVRIASEIAQLTLNPRPAGAKSLAGGDGFWRIRVGDWRIIYTTERSRLIVLILRLGHRREIYRAL